MTARPHPAPAAASRPAARALALAAALLWAALAPGPAAAQETAEARPADGPPELALYRTGDALVREPLSFRLAEGTNRLVWSGAPRGLDPSSLSLSFPGDGRVAVLQSLYLPPATEAGDALRGLVGREVVLEMDDGDPVRGTLRAAGETWAVETGARGAVGAGDGGGAATVVRPGRVRSLRIPGLPESYRTEPRVEWRVRSPAGGTRRAELGYLTGGLSWDADYVMELSRDEERFSLAGWAVLDNGTGRAWSDARVRLVAGEVQRVDGGDGRRRAALRMAEDAAAPGAAGAEERGFAEYRLYELPRRVTLPADGTLRARLLRAADVPVRKEWVVTGGPGARYAGRSHPVLGSDAGREEGREHARVDWIFSTAEDGGVGRDLPAGRVRVYRRDEDGTFLLAGEDRLPAVPRDDSARVTTGRAFRVTRDREQTAFRRPDAGTLEEGFRLALENAGEDPVELRVVEHLYRWDEWTVLDARLDGEPAGPRKRDVDTVEWRVPLPAGSERVLTYTVRYTFPPGLGR